MSVIARDVDGRRGATAPPTAHGDVRVGPLLAIPALLREYGIDPSLVLAQIGLDACIFEDPDNRISFDALGRLLETCVKRTGCRHFGLLVGRRFELHALGVLGQLMRNSPTLRDALRLASLHLELHDRGAISLGLDLGGGESVLGYSLFVAKTPAAEQILDGAIAMQYLLLRELCGPSWKALRVQFSHRRPSDIAPFRKCFRARLEFDAPISGIVFLSKWLNHAIDGANPDSFAVISRAIESDQSHRMMPFAMQVRRALQAMILTGSTSSVDLARLFNVSERTLRRRLAEEGLAVRDLVGETRRNLANQLLRDSDLPVSEIAEVLSYSDATVFARAFRGWSKMSPREWRARYASAPSGNPGHA